MLTVAVATVDLLTVAGKLKVLSTPAVLQVPVGVPIVEAASVTL